MGNVSPMTSWRRRATVILAGSLLVAGCTRPEDARRADESLPPTPTEATTTTAPSPPSDDTEPTEPTTGTTAPVDTTSSTAPTTAPTSSSAPATTAAPPSTTEPPDSPDDLVFTFDSIGPWRFGDRDVDVVPGLAAILGAPIDDVLTDYPVADEGSFLDETGEQSYVSPYGRTVCFAVALCVQFGAGAPETLIFTGWRLADEAPPELATDDGVVIGATWADHADVLTFDPFDSCFQLGYADAGGIDVVLLSATEPFVAPNDAGDVVPGDTDPEQVTVIELRAGRHPTFVFADC